MLDSKQLFSSLAKIIEPASLSLEPADLEIYGKDWSGVTAPNASLICFPKNTQEVSKILRFCFENNIGVVPSGGRTGLSGGAMAIHGEIVLSLEKMNKIFAPDLFSRTLRVQAGAITEAVHQALRPFDLTWPVDFASKGSSQVGGNLATNAGGINVIRYGNTRNWVLAIQAVLMDGTILELNHDLEKNNTGYDLRNLLIGSEGTLAVITEATLKICPIEKEKKLLMIGLESMNEVAKVFESCNHAGLLLSAYEYLNRESYDCSVKFAGFESPLGELSPNTKAICLIEVITNTDNLENKLNLWLEKLFENNHIQNAIQAESASQTLELWRIREGIAEAIMHNALVHQHDVSVPVSKLVSFSKEVEDFYASKYPALNIFIFGHIGDGNLHIFIQKPSTMSKEDFHTRCQTADSELFTLIQKYTGSTSAEHGIGLWKKVALPYSRTATEIEIMRGIKKVFDPKGLMNPGKMLP